MKIPQHCIDIFVKNNHIYPSIIDFVNINNRISNFARKGLESYKLLWFHTYVGLSDSRQHSEYLMEYDQTGIYFFYHRDDLTIKNDCLSILLLPEKKENVEFLIKSIIQK